MLRAGAIILTFWTGFKLAISLGISSQSTRARSRASLLIAILVLVAPASNVQGANANQILRPIDLARILDSKSFHVVVRTAEIPRLPFVSAKVIRLGISRCLKHWSILENPIKAAMMWREIILQADGLYLLGFLVSTF